MNYELKQEVDAAGRIVRVAQAYADAQHVLDGYKNPSVSDRQWQACCLVASRFLADPDAMTPQQCHHEWRLSQMRSSHPAFWPTAVATEWGDLSVTDRMLESIGLRAMRDELQRIETEQEERLIAHLHADAQQMQDEALAGALDQMLRNEGD